MRLLKMGTAVEQSFANHSIVQDRGHIVANSAESQVIYILFIFFLY